MEITKNLSNEELCVLSVFSSLPFEQLFPHGAVPAPDGQILLEILKEHRLLRSFASRVIGSSLHVLLDDKAVTGCRDALCLWEMEKLIYCEGLERIGSVLDSRNIHYCLLKGLSLQYGFAPRDMSDLDILVGQNDLVSVDQVMTDLGFRYIADERKPFMRRRDMGRNFQSLAAWTNQFEYLDDKTGLLVEIHTGFFERSRVYSFDTGPLWSTTGPVFERCIFREDLGCRVLAPSDLLWLMAMHAAFRSSASRNLPELRYHVDMAAIIHDQKPDWELLVFQADQSRTSGFLAYSFETLLKVYPGSVPDSVIEHLNMKLTRNMRLVKHIQHRCFISFTKSSPFFRFLYRMILPFAYGGNVREKIKSILVFPRIFMSPGAIAWRCGIRMNSRFIWALSLLEPLRIIIRVLRFIFKPFRKKKHG